METSLKTCFKCKQEKPRSEFYKHHKMGDGLLGKCKDCTKKDTIENRNKNLAYYIEYDKKRAMLPHRVKAREEYSKTENGILSIKKSRKKYNKSDKKRSIIKKWRKENREKYLAHNRVNNSIRNGKITKFPCFICGDIKSHAHHEDYSKPLEVLWLCYKHHCMAHGQLLNENTFKPSRLEAEK